MEKKGFFMKFQNMVGQEQTIKHLQNVIQMKKVSHAYIIQGEAGSGKKMLANTFATALQCENLQLPIVEPCGHCASCKQAASQNHPDIRRVTHEKATIGVDDIRLQLNNDILIRPYKGPYKIYIIEEAEKMTEQAQNAILKTIEEPPDYAVILLLTVNAKLLLPTILSRCILLNLHSVARDEIKQLLIKHHGISDYMAEIAADFADGVPGKAIAYAQSSEFISQKEEIIYILRHFDTISSQELYKKIKEWAGRKSEILDLLSFIHLWFRDILIIKATSGKGKTVFREESEQLKRQAELFSYAELEHCFDEIELTRKRFLANVNLEVSLEMLFYSMKNPKGKMEEIL